MGEKMQYQPLTTGDKISVLFYRTGLMLVTLQLLYGAYFMILAKPINTRDLSTYITILHLLTGLSVINIHLYVKRFRYFIRGLYAFSLLIVGLLLLYRGMGFGELFLVRPQTAILLLPVAGCIAFFGVKEACCFRIMEGYISALLLVLSVFGISIAGFQSRAMGILLMLTSLIYALFIIKKIFMPLAYDIGDKSAYE